MPPRSLRGVSLLLVVPLFLARNRVLIPIRICSGIHVGYRSWQASPGGTHDFFSYTVIPLHLSPPRLCFQRTHQNPIGNFDHETKSSPLLMFPVRCYTCGCVLAHLHQEWEQHRLMSQSAATTLDNLKVAKMCCRRMFLSEIDLTKDQIQHPNVDRVLDEGGTVFQRLARQPRTVSCD